MVEEDASKHNTAYYLTNFREWIHLKPGKVDLVPYKGSTYQNNKYKVGHETPSPLALEDN